MPLSLPSTSGRGGVPGTGRPVTHIARATADAAGAPPLPPFTHPPDAAGPAPALIILRAPTLLLTDPPPVAPPLAGSDTGIVANPSFEPVLSPGIAVAAAAAATPPIVFWARIALNARRVAKEAEAKEAARLERLARLDPGRPKQQQ